MNPDILGTAATDKTASSPTANTGPSNQKLDYGKVFAWGMWDWGSSAFNAVVTTFVFTVYLTRGGFGSEKDVSSAIGLALGIAGVIVFLIAPVAGQRSDFTGRRKFWLGVDSFFITLAIAALFFIRPAPEYLAPGLILLAFGTVMFELATVNYNAMLSQLATRSTIGKTSGLGWGMGYLGGIVLLLILYFGFIKPDVGLFGVTSADGLWVRVSMLIAAAWFGLSAIPLFLKVSEVPGDLVVAAHRPSHRESLKHLWQTIRKMFNEDRNTLLFLIASAVFRDGLTGVFAFGGVLAASVLGFSAGEVLMYAIVANIMAGISTVIAGRLDDRYGAKPVIMAALIGLVVFGLAMFFLHDLGQLVFWITGLLLSAFVGPAQSSNRAFLARLIPPGKEGEIFGLYATTGRAVTPLSPFMWALFVSTGGATYWGIVGLAIVLLAGLLLLIPVKAAAREPKPAKSAK